MSREEMETLVTKDEETLCLSPRNEEEGNETAVVSIGHGYLGYWARFTFRTDEAALA